MSYIEREKLMAELQKKIDLSHNARRAVIEEDFIAIIDDMPAADVVEVRHSYWQCSNVRMSSRDITCRYCHRTETISNGNEDFEYCPHCGTKMDGKDGDE